MPGSGCRVLDSRINRSSRYLAPSTPRFTTSFSSRPCACAGLCRRRGGPPFATHHARKKRDEGATPHHRPSRRRGSVQMNDTSLPSQSPPRIVKSMWSRRAPPYEGRTFARGYPGMAERHRGVPLGDFVFQFDFGRLAAELGQTAVGAGSIPAVSTTWTKRNLAARRRRKPEVESSSLSVQTNARGSIARHSSARIQLRGDRRFGAAN